MDSSGRVIHHAHLSGTIFGSAHSKCNPRKSDKFLSVFLLKSWRNNARSILQDLKHKIAEKLSEIAKTDKTYI